MIGGDLVFSLVTSHWSLVTAPEGREGGGTLNRKGLVPALILAFLIGMAAHAAGQVVPAQPGQSEEQNIPVMPGAPDLTGTGGAITLPAGQRFAVQPYLYAREQYTSNVYLTKDNKKDDWITTLGPGIRLSVNDPSFGADLAGNFGYNWYANNTKDDYWSIDGTLGLRYNPTPQLTFRVREYILRSENTSENYYPQGGQPAPPGVSVGTNQGNSPYLRNIVEPSVNWQFSRQGSVGILYRNNILRNEDSTFYEDSTENYVRPSFSYWLDQRNNIALDYGFTMGSYSGGPGPTNTPDFVSHNPHGRYTYRFDAQMSAFLDYAYAYQDNDDPGISYNVNNPSVGITYAFNPNLVGLAQVGYYLMQPDRGDDVDGISGNLSITQRDRQTTYTLALFSGYEQNQFSFENLGFNKYYGGSAAIEHSLTQRFNIGFIGSARYTDYAFVDRNDWIYTADATASYQIFKWLTLSGIVGYQQDDSSNDVNSYDEWHAFLTLRASFDNLLYGR
jgi:hypothetical protein